jgi:CDP-diacylglycerol--glycerol-3-phosphate 3-phosphatidyltransferase
MSASVPMPAPAQRTVAGRSIGPAVSALRTTPESHWSGWPLSALTRCRRHRTPLHRKERVASLANGLTLVRLIATIALLSTAIYVGSSALLLIGLLGSWLFDTVDGHVARSRECETVFGAQFDAAVDRVTVLLAVLGSTVLSGGHPGVIAAAAIVWLQYGVADQVLFAQFLRFELWTPDEFHEVDESVWLVSWSQLAKIVSGTPTAALAIGGVIAYCGAALAFALIVVRLVCYARIAKGCSSASTAGGPIRLTVR